MKSILVLAGGAKSDRAVFETALSIARPLEAHLEFLHVRLSAGQAAYYTPHAGFAVGEALKDAFRSLRAESEERSRTALRHFEELCEKDLINITLDPRDAGLNCVSASWCEQKDGAVDGMTHYARHNDLVVLARSSHANGLPADLVERLLLSAGRPLLLAPGKAARHRSGTAVVFWKESADSARALMAAMPLLRLSQRVVIVSAFEQGNETPACIDHLVQRLAWNGIAAEAQWLKADEQPVSLRLQQVATDLDADLLVMGAYGYGRARALIFGGCTRHFLEQSDRPVLMMH